MTLTQIPTSPENLSSEPEKRQDFYYPYASDIARDARMLRDEGIHIKEWYAPGIDIDDVLAKARGPVLEIGGPTETGYYFLDYRPLPSRPVMGNLSTTLFDEARTQRQDVELIIDGRDMPFGDETLGVVLSAHLPRYGDYRLEGPMTKKDTDERIHDLALAYAKKVLEDVARTHTVEQTTSELSLRFDIAREVYDKLMPGGLYFTDGDPFEIDAFKELGFEVIARFDEKELVHMTGSDESYLSVVLQKPETGALHAE